jgi:MFS family permease
MAPLSILLLVQDVRDAYSIAGFVTGAFAVGSAVGTPVWGRLMDRLGQITVLLPTSLASAAFLVGLAVATTGGGSTALLIMLSTLAGLSYPPVSPAMRAAWRVILHDPAARRVAFALDATSVELIFVGGPLLVSMLLAFASPVAPLLVTAALMAAGGVAYCRTDAARLSVPAGSRPEASDDHLSPKGKQREHSVVAAPGVAALLLVMLAMSIGFGQLDTSLAAAAGTLLGGTEQVGALFAAIAGGSTVGGLAFGARTWRFDERRAVALLLAVFALLLAAMAVLMSLPSTPFWLVLVLLVVTGATIAPTLIMQQSLLDQLSPAHRLNEAQAFLSASNTTGAAVGTAAAGLLIDYRGLGWSFAGAALCTAAAGVIAASSQRRWRAASQVIEEGADPDGTD